MKTLVVLSTLVSLAIAAPALPGEGVEDTVRSQDWQIQVQSKLPDVLKREKKSPTEINTSSILNTAAPNIELQNVHQIDSGAPTPMGRSFVLKKPLIVKKKYGYQLYRDSEEEKAHADSQESCGRQVKVKLCDEDGKFRHKGGKGAHEMTDIHTSEDDVKHSIRMAKEAVENLQRDLKKIELKSDMKTAHESESDTELHEDIEVARQALEHIHDNFGTLESMSLHATTTKDSESIRDVHVTISKTEEERMAQWKEAIENIQKNVEIARNIEDSFKAASSQDHLLPLDQSEAATTLDHQKLFEKTDSHAPLMEINHMRAVNDAETEMHHMENVAGEDKLLNKATNEHLSEHNAGEGHHTDDDMQTDASEMIETHIDNARNHHSLRSENHVVHKEEKSAELKLEEINAHITNKDLDAKENIADHHHHNHQEKIAEPHSEMLTDQSEHQITQLPSIKAVEEGLETKLNMEKDAAFKTPENIPEAHEITNMDGHITPSDIISEHTQQRTVEEKDTDDKTEHHHHHHHHNVQHLKLKKSADHMTADDDKIDFLAKSVDHVDTEKMEKENLHEITATGKTAENVAEPIQHLTENVHMNPKEANRPLHEIKHEEHLDHIPKATEHLEMTHFVPSGDLLLAKSVDHGSILDHQQQQMIEREQLSHVDTIPMMKAAQGERLHLIEHMHAVQGERLHPLEHMHAAHLAHESRQLAHLSSMKAAEGIEKDFDMTHRLGHGIITDDTMNQMRSSHLAEHSQIPSKMGASHDFELSNLVHPQHQNAGRNQNAMTHSNLHEMTGMGSDMHPNFHTSMRDAMESFESDHIMRWKPTHESARGAGYGAGYGAGLSGPIGSPGAVGVFPNAHIGGCAIPLLLSCSPSVVSGSLAKGQGAYGGPAYRTEDEFGFHNKRDTKKTNEMRTLNALRTPTFVNQKTTNLLENKV